MKIRFLIVASVLSAASLKTDLVLETSSDAVQELETIQITCHLQRPPNLEHLEVKSVKLYIKRDTATVLIFSMSGGHVEPTLYESRYDKKNIKLEHFGSATLCYNGDIICEVHDGQQLYTKGKYLAVNGEPMLSICVDSICQTSQSGIKLEAGRSAKVSCQTQNFKESHTINAVSSPDIPLRSEEIYQDCAESVLVYGNLQLEPGQKGFLKCTVDDRSGNKLNYSKIVQFSVDDDVHIQLSMDGHCVTCTNETTINIESNRPYEASCVIEGLNQLENASLWINRTLGARTVFSISNTATITTTLEMKTGDRCVLSCNVHGKTHKAELPLDLALNITAVSPDQHLYINGTCVSCKDPPEFTVNEIASELVVKCAVPNLPSIRSLKIEGLSQAEETPIGRREHLLNQKRMTTGKLHFVSEKAPYKLNCRVTTTDGQITTGASVAIILRDLPEPKLFINKTCVSCNNPPKVVINETQTLMFVQCEVPNLTIISALQIEGLPNVDSNLIPQADDFLNETRIRVSMLHFDPNHASYELHCRVTGKDGRVTLGTNVTINLKGYQTRKGHSGQSQCSYLPVIVVCIVAVLVVLVTMYYAYRYKKKNEKKTEISDRMERQGMMLQQQST